MLSYLQPKRIHWEDARKLCNTKTDFKYEIIIHDDASTDGTVEIIKEYEKNYAGLIHPIYQLENQYSKGVDIEKLYLFPQIRGKYFALCEGDDYWCDEGKLQAQYNVMENMTNCSLCVHKTRVINKDGRKMKQCFPFGRVKKGIVTPDEYMNEEIGNIKWLFQLSSFFARASHLKEYTEHAPEFSDKFVVGDMPMVLYLITKGPIYYIPQEWSCYRYMSGGFMSSLKKSRQLEIQTHNSYIDGLQCYNKYTNGRYQQAIEKHINYREMLVRYMKREYKELFLPKYKECHKYFGKVFWIKVFIAVYVPWLWKGLQKFGAIENIKLG